MIEGIATRKLAKHTDERGFFVEIVREDWEDIFNGENVVQFNLSYSYPGTIRAWHRHTRGQVDFFICIKGSVKLCAYDEREKSETFGEIDEIVLSSESLEIARIPGILWHGYKALGSEPIKLLYGVNRLYDYKNPDEERRPWNDPKIVPKCINGETDDKRIGKPWNWNYLPYK